MAIKRTQFGSGFKLKPKYLGPYQVSKVKPNDTYDVVKVGLFEGPRHNSSCAEYKKLWCPIDESESEDEFEANSTQNGRVVGI